MKESNISNYLSLAVLESIINNSEDAIITKTLEGIITGWNKASERIFGYGAAEAVGKHITLLIPRERWHEEDLILMSLKQGNRIQHFETTRKKKDGTEITVSLTISPIKDELGEIIGASKIVRDVTEKKHSEARQALLAAIVSSSEDAIIGITLDGYIASWNKGAEKMFGYSELEVLGKNISLLIPESRKAEEDIILGKIKNGETVNHFETVRQAKDKHQIPISLTVSAIKDVTGKIVGASKIARDISERVLMEQQLQEYNDRLERLNSSKDEFIGMASHELKTPLTSITGYLQLLNRNLEGKQNLYFLNKAINQVTKLTSLVADLLDISKIEAGKLHLRYSDFNIVDLMTDCIETVEQMYPSHTVIFDTQIPAIPVVADKLRIEQVILNLLTNAVKYSPHSHEVIVSQLVEENTVKFSIRDFGIGIENSQLSQIFTRFYRVEGLAPTLSGLGIGLFISKEIIERHHGKLYAESEPGKGSIFYFELPLN